MTSVTCSVRSKRRTPWGRRTLDCTGPKWRTVQFGELYCANCQQHHELHSSPKLFGCSNQEEWDRRGMWHVWETGEILTGCLLRRIEGRRQLGRPRNKREHCIRQVASRCEQGNEISLKSYGSSWISEEMLFLKQDSAPWNELVS